MCHVLKMFYLFFSLYIVPFVGCLQLFAAVESQFYQGTFVVNRIDVAVDCSEGIRVVLNKRCYLYFNIKGYTIPLRSRIVFSLNKNASSGYVLAKPDWMH